jgi:hypothetical protein
MGRTLPAEERRKLEQLQVRYGDPDSSGLKYTVRPGEQTHDIPLD